MTRMFSSVGLMGKPDDSGAKETLLHLLQHIQSMGLHVIVESLTAEQLYNEQLHIHTCSKTELAQNCELIIVVGGDGSMLNGARAFTDANVPVLGINRGHLGFLTDVTPHEATEKVSDILRGAFIEEKRFLLQTHIERQHQMISNACALNDVVLYSGEVARIIEFEVYIDEQFVCSLRSDGLVVATPTGSTAYALSGGGPILHPSLNAIVLVPLCPHTLSSRPIVVDGDSKIELVIASSNRHHPQLSCDGQIDLPLQNGDSVIIQKKTNLFRLLHPEEHDYYHVLRTKLGWGTKL